jgi:lipoprotein-anchoring transpeptidase ErfK/SrfK
MDMPSERDPSLRPTLPLPLFRARAGRSAGPPDDAPTQALDAIPGDEARSSGLPAPDWLLIGLAGSLGLLVLLIAAIGVVLLSLYAGDRIVPGVEALGLDLSGRHKNEAVALLQRSWAARTIVLDTGDATWSVSPSMLGIGLDAEATVELAHRQGRSWAALKGVLTGQDSIQVSPVWRLDEALGAANLQVLAAQFAIAPINAGLSVVDGRAHATPPILGRSVDVAASMARLAQNVDQVIAQKRLYLVMVPVDPAITDASGLVAQADQLLAHPLAIHFYDPITNERQTLDVGPEVWGAWLSLGVDPGDATRLAWELSRDRTAAYLDGQVTQPGSDRRLDLDEALDAVRGAIQAQRADVSLRLYHAQRQYIVQAGETLSSIAYEAGMPYPWIQQANPGLGDTLSVGQVVIIPSLDVLLPLPVVENKRIVVSLGQQRMWAYENDALKWEWPVSTGIDSSPTSPGVFQIQTHELNAYASNWDLWMPHFMGIYRPVPSSDFMNGFHGFPTRGGSTLLWSGNLGHPVTYGCILISSANAATLYEWAEAGVVVEVQP